METRLLNNPLIRSLVCIVTTLLLFGGLTELAYAKPRRFAVLIGANDGDASEEGLRYAEDDARRIGTILRDLGGFRSEDVLFLTDVDASEVRRSLLRINAKLRDIGGESLLFVFYSGHGDNESLHLRGSRFPMSEIKDLLNGSAATARVLVLDACRSGALTRVKGGKPGPSFAIEFEDSLGTEGVAILTSSAANEDSQESDNLKGSFFTHYLASALLGAADRNGDASVTLGEAFQYAAERTLAATAQTVSGPQHPTYRYTLGGREDLLLTQTDIKGRRYGSLQFQKPGTYLVQQEKEGGRLVAEVTTDVTKGTVALREGYYFVTRREPSSLHQKRVYVNKGKTTLLRVDSMESVAYAHVVRKGGTRMKHSSSLIADSGARGSILGLGVAPFLGMAWRRDQRQLSWETRIGMGRSSTTNRYLKSVSNELTGSAAVSRAFDISALSFHLGIEVGASWFHQQYEESPQSSSRNSLALFVGPLAEIHVPLRGRYFARLTSSIETYFFNVEGKDSTFSTPVVWRSGLGIGRFF